MPDWLLNVSWLSGSANATTFQRDEEGGDDQMLGFEWGSMLWLILTLTCIRGR
jgi:hypothetical protein